MPATTESHRDLLDATRRRAHNGCVVCDPSNAAGLGLAFTVIDDGAVRAAFNVGPDLQGYSGVVHGGVISSVLDGAMTNCLFARGIVAVTGEMTVRFRHPVRVDAPAEVTARLTRRQVPLSVLEAEIAQAGRVVATATGKFMDQPELA
jgi:uncharacterized protein (TIGR00369 family)